MVRFYLLSVSVILGLGFQSCDKITQSTEVSFIEVNALLIDSINTLKAHNAELYSTLLNDPSIAHVQEDVVSIRRVVNSLNNAIIKVKDHIVDSAKHTSDKETPQKVLIEENNANLLLEIANEARSAIIIFESFKDDQVLIDRLIFPNKYNIPEGQSWDEYLFKNMPLYAVVPMMNRWVYNNELFVQGELERLQ